MTPRYTTDGGQEIANGDIIGKGVFFQDPLYPYFLGLIYSIFGQNLPVVLVIQALLGSSIATVIFLIGKRLANNHVGFISSILWAFYTPIIFYEGLIMKEGISVFLIVASLYALVVARETQKSVHWLLSGILMGLSVLTRGNILFVIPFMLIWVSIEYREKSLSILLPYIVGLLIILLPVSVRNKVVGGEFVLTTSQAGANFYLGNNEHVMGSFSPIPSFVRPNPVYEQQDFATEAMRRTGRNMTASEVSGYWFGKGMEFIISNPLRYLWLEYQKVLLLFNKSEISDNYPYYYYKRFSTIINYSPVDFWLVGSLGILGMIVTASRWRDLLPLYLFFTSYSFSLIIFYVHSRYRLPIAPCLAIFAGLAVYWMWENVSKKGYFSLTWASALLILLLLFVGKDIHWLTIRNRTEVLHREGFDSFEKGNYDEAMFKFVKVAELSPSNYAGNFGLGEVLMKKREPHKAISAFKKAVESMPKSALAHFKLGMAYVETDSLDEAVREFQTSIVLVPGQADSYYGLALAFEKKGIKNESAVYLKEYLKRAPDGEWSDIARIKIEEGRVK